MVVAGALLGLPSSVEGKGTDTPTEGRRGRARFRVRSDNRPSTRAYEHWLKAEFASSLGQPELASRQLRLARVYDERSPTLLEAEGRVALELGRPDLAERAASKLRRGLPRSRLERDVALSRGRRAVGPATRIFARTHAPEDRAALVRAWAAEGELDRALSVVAGAEPEERTRLALALDGPERAPEVLARLVQLVLPTTPERGVWALRTEHRLGRDAQALERARVFMDRWPSAAELRVEGVRTALWTSRLELAETWAEQSARLGVDASALASAFVEERVPVPATLLAGAPLTAGVGASPAARPSDAPLHTLPAALVRRVWSNEPRPSDLEVLAAALARHPDAPGLVALWGRSQLGEDGHGVDALRRSVRHHPDAAWVWTALADGLDASGAPDAASVRSRATRLAEVSPSTAQPPVTSKP